MEYSIFLRNQISFGKNTLIFSKNQRRERRISTKHLPPPPLHIHCQSWSKGGNEFNGRTPWKCSVIIFRLWIFPRLDHLYFSYLIYWVIDTTRGLWWTNGKRRTIGWNTGKFSFFIFRLPIGYILNISAKYCLAYRVVVIIWTHIWQYFLVYIFYHHKTLLSIGHIGSFIEFPLSYFDNNWRVIVGCDSSDSVTLFWCTLRYHIYRISC